MPLTTPKISSYNSDSETEDEDYVPPERQSSDSEDSAVCQNQSSSVPAADDPEEKKRKREELWAEFQASVCNSKPPETNATAVKMVKIEKRYKFAGDEVVETVEVPEDSPEAKTWPLHRDPDAPSPSSATQTTQAMTAGAGQSATIGQEEESELPLSTTPSTTSLEVLPSTAKPAAGKRPGPRKSKITLASLPGPKAKKLTTLDKSAMDWRAHIQAEEESGSSLKDDLEANRRAGGYLEKVGFLKRVEERREENLDAIKSKRRKL